VDLSGESRTYLQSREKLSGDGVLPLFEYLNFSLDDFAAQNLSFHMGGWVRQDLVQEESFDDRNFNGDLQYAYLDFRRETGNTLFNLGRLLVDEGVATELVDGLLVGTELLGGFGISAYGGIPVETDYDERDGDSIFGGRLFHSMPNWYRVGLSYLKEKNDSNDFRTEAGVDLRLFPGKRVELFGRSTYNGETSGWSEHSYYLTLNALQNLRISSEVVSTNYEDYFQAVDDFSVSTFNFQPGILDPREKLLVLGGQVEYGASENLTVAAGYKNYDYSVVDGADYYGGQLIYAIPDRWGAGLSLYRMDGQTDSLKYYESRAYGYKGFGKADVTLDFFNVTYDEERSGIKNAFTAVAALGYNLTDKARIAVDVDYSRNPTFDYDLRGFVKFLYGFDVSPLLKPRVKAPAVAEKQPPAAQAVPVEEPKVAAPAPEAAPAKPIPEPTVVPEPALDPQTAQMVAWTERLRNTPTDKYTIQVEISGSLDLIWENLERLLPEYDAMVVPYEVRGVKAYTLVTGIYDSRAAGNAAVQDLPAAIRKLGPLVKTLPTIQKGLIPPFATKGSEAIQTAPPLRPSSSVPAGSWEEKMVAWTERLRRVPTDKYTIQVEISGSLDGIWEDLERLLPEYGAMVVPYQVAGIRGYTLVVGIYNSRAEGNAAVQDLPATIRKLGPLVKTLPTIQKGLIPVAR
jgi:septal ring-binding cell division protein DamX